MTFSTNIPAPADKLRNFPGDVTTNEWPRIKANIIANHVFQNTAGVTPGFAEDQSGFHTIAAFQNQAADPANIADATQLYTKTQDGDNHLFALTAANVFKQITGKALKNANGYTMLPGGFLLQWGGGSTGGGPNVVNFPVAFSALYQVLPMVNDRSATVTAQSNSSFTFTIPNPTVIVYRWFAIGLQ